MTVDLSVLASKLREKYGVCYAAHILREVYGLKLEDIGRLLGRRRNAVGACLSWARRRGLGFPSFILPPDRSVEPEDLEYCLSQPLSLECQSLESELFVYNVARGALPVTAFWHVVLWLRAIHRVVFPAVYHYLRSLEDAGEARGLLRAYKSGGRWIVGAGIAVYAYVALIEALAENGLVTAEREMAFKRAIEKMAGVRLVEHPKLYLTISYIVDSAVARKKSEILERVEALYRAAERGGIAGSTLETT